MMIQLYQPLNFLGMVYRDIRQAKIDLEMMFDILAQHPEIADRPGAKPLAVSGGHLRFDNVFFHYDPAREILKGISFDVPPGQTVAIVGPSGAGKVDDFAADLPLLRTVLGADHDRRPGHRRRDAEFAARRDRHGAAGYGALQRYDRLQYPLRPRRRERRRGERGGASRADRSLHRKRAGRLSMRRWASAG